MRFHACADKDVGNFGFVHLPAEDVSTGWQCRDAIPILAPKAFLEAQMYRFPSPQAQVI
jgi:hypothetical protein